MSDDPDIKKIVRAAKERASFDKVSEMLRIEFSEGLRNSHKYSEDTIKKVVPQIVNATHDVRHKGLIDKFGWSENPEIQNVVSIMDPKERKDVSSSTDTLLIHKEPNEIYTSDSYFQKLIPFAQIGCAHSILKRIKPRLFKV